MKRLIYPIIVAGIIVSMVACSAKVRTAPNPDFEAKRYLGDWYEIARIDNVFEEGLDSVKATYLFFPDGEIKVINRGYGTEKLEWREIDGVAKRTKTPNYFRVYFHKTFPSAYRVAYVDSDYSVAVVTGKTLRYGWILSRTPQLSESKLRTALTTMENLGYDTNDLVYPKQ